MHLTKTSTVVRCLFDDWRARPRPVLDLEVDCSGHERTGLCYGAKNITLFAACFNNKTLIPEFTGHVVRPATKRSGKRAFWKNEGGTHGKKKFKNTFSTFLFNNVSIFSKNINKPQT